MCGKFWKINDERGKEKMTEQKQEDAKKEEEVKPETPIENNDAGNEPQKTALVDGAHTAAERIEAANKKLEELLNRQEDLDAKRRLGGTTEAGGESKTPEETEKEKIEADAKTIVDRFN